MDPGRISSSFIPSLFSPFTHSVCQSLPYFLTLPSPSVHDDTFRRYHTPLTVEDKRGRGCTVNRAAHVASIKLISVESSPPTSSPLTLLAFIHPPFLLKTKKNKDLLTRLTRLRRSGSSYEGGGRITTILFFNVSS